MAKKELTASEFPTIELRGVSVKAFSDFVENMRRLYGDRKATDVVEPIRLLLAQAEKAYSSKPRFPAGSIGGPARRRRST